MSDTLTAGPAVSLPAPVVYPERKVLPDHWLDWLASAITGIPVALLPVRNGLGLAGIVRRVAVESSRLSALSDAALHRKGAEVRTELRRNGLGDEAVARSFALVQEIAGRKVGLRHYDVQLIGGYALLKGKIAEMDTGEGKTLAATLPAATAAMAGIPVHVVTVNDYLAARDAGQMRPIYEALGLTVGVVVHGMSPEQRRAAYHCDVTYCTNKEAAFDYLRDRLVMGQVPSNLRLKLEKICGPSTRTDRLVMRGLNFAIVDEADSVLIDEARTPLIISGETDPADEARRAGEALTLVEGLEQGEHFEVLLDERRIELTHAGRRALKDRAAMLGDLWMGGIRREEAARNALAALNLFNRDEHYLVRDGEIQIIDEYTGRVMADRSWGEGLHQLIEAKESCPVTGRKVPLARMTYQRFFRRYRHLSGMTGTARETAGELWSVYRLPVVRIPTHCKPQRGRQPDMICATAEEKWRRISEIVARLYAEGRPVLLGTRSVVASEHAGDELSKAGLPFVVLNAAQDEEEAEIIARAGTAGRITVATNMAGRGVDIKLAPEVLARGGLHVIMSERHDAGRIDRQLIGRCARQGEPGSTKAILSLDDPLLEHFGNSLLRRMAYLPGFAGQWFGRFAFARAQRRAERTHSRMRRDLLKYDQRLNTLLAFSGRME